MTTITNRPRQGGKNTELIHSLQAENKRLLALLAHERDEFGKKETEFLAKLTRLSDKTGFCAQCETYARENERLKKEAAGTLIPHSARCMEMEKALVAESEIKRLREALKEIKERCHCTELCQCSSWMKHRAKSALEDKK